jgi:UDP:flavonoid glycosyltransferase YjiC (YdhE family)
MAGHPFLAGGEPPKRTGEASAAGNKKRLGHLAALALLELMERTVQDWRPDVILREPYEYASAAVAARLSVPVAQIAIGLAGDIWNSIDKAAPELDAFHDGLAGELRQSPFLTRMPASLDASPFPATWRYRMPAVTPREALPAWWADSGAPLVYVSFGTVVSGKSQAGEVYRALIDAVSGLGARVLLTVGRDFDIARLRDVPANVRLEAWVDQADVLDEAGLVVCHSGSGTVYGALAAGVPLVVIPMFGDHFANATAVARASVGLQVLTGQDAQGRPRLVSREDAPRIRQAIETVLTDGSYRQAARSVAAEMAAAPTIGALLGQLPRHR